MGKYVAVFTATLFLTALFQCCFAADSVSASEDPVSAYVTVIIAKCIKKTIILLQDYQLCDLPSYSTLLYDITSQDPSNPSKQSKKMD